MKPKAEKFIMNVNPVGYTDGPGISNTCVPEAVKQKMKTQYPATTFQETQLSIDPEWSVHVEISGNPEGIPVVFVHGGPGIRFKKEDHQWFDPDKYRVIVFQQRGTWNCNPSVEDFMMDARYFKGVTIQTLAQDIETIRKKLGIEKWLVFGGSWGSTLSLHYAQCFPKSCTGLVLRGVYLGTDDENKNLFDEAVLRNSCGEAWDPRAIDCLIKYAAKKGIIIDRLNHRSFYSAYRELAVDLNDLTACRLWSAFEDYIEDPSNQGKLNDLLSDELETTPEERSIAVFETQIFEALPDSVDLVDSSNLARLKEIPIQIVQGKKDKICLHSVAEALAELLKNSECNVRIDVIENGGHSPYHPEMTHALVSATDIFAEQGNFG